MALLFTTPETAFTARRETGFDDDGNPIIESQNIGIFAEDHGYTILVLEKISWIDIGARSFPSVKAAETWARVSFQHNGKFEPDR